VDNMEKIRSFIAIELPGEVKAALAKLQTQLRAAGSAPIKWVEPGSIHLTLKFLGDVDIEITGKITAALEEATRGIHPFAIGVEGLGVFPNMRRVQVIWVGLTGELEKLSGLQKRIEASLVPLGFAVEGRPFAPHLTLARVRDYVRPEERQKLGDLVSATAFKDGYRIDVSAVHLIKSQLTGEGPIYTKIGTVTLK
jgi:2'-5' RNA ligase